MHYSLPIASVLLALTSTTLAQDTHDQDLCRYVREGYCSLGVKYHPGVSDSSGDIYVFGQHCNSILSHSGAACDGNLCSKGLHNGKDGRFSLTGKPYQVSITDFYDISGNFHFAYAGFSVDSSKGCDCQSYQEPRGDAGRVCRCEFQCNQK